MLIQYGSLKRKIVAVSFFGTVSLNNFFSLKFDPNLTSHNTGLRNDSMKTIPCSESAGRLLSNGKPQNMLRLHSFGTFWTLSTQNQWEITRVGKINLNSTDAYIWPQKKLAPKTRKLQIQLRDKTLLIVNRP